MPDTPMFRLVMFIVRLILSVVMRISNAIEAWRHFWWYRRTPAQPRNAFTTAVLENDVAFVRAALEGGLDANTRLPDTQEKGRFDPTEGGRKEVPSALLKYIPTALMVAAAHGYVEIAQILLEFGADLKLRKGDEPKRSTVMDAAASAGQTEMVAFLLSRMGGENLHGSCFETALVSAATGGYDATVKLLLESGANVNIHDNDANASSEGVFSKEERKVIWKIVVDGVGTTALIEAVYSIQESTVTLLLEHGADVNLIGRGGETPLMAAASCNQPQIVRILIAAGAEIDARDDEGRTALWWAKKPQVRSLLKAAGGTK